MAEEQEKINVVFGAGELVKELIVRHGQAEAALPPPKQIAIVGTIESPRLFVLHRKELHDVKKCYVAVDRAKAEIWFFEDEKNPYRTTVHGQLVMSPELAAFKINTGTKLGLKETTNFLRMRRAYFPDRDEHKNLIDKLSKFAAKVQTEIAAKDDRKGNTYDLVATKVSHDIPLDFKLELRLFIGQPKASFKVEILADVTVGGISFWLESVELAEMSIKAVDKIIDAELKAFKDYLVIEA